MLELFNSDVRLCNNGKPAKPSVVVTDFSYALIHAILLSFNRMSLVTYLRTTFAILNGKCTGKEIQSLTFIAVCCAHMIKAISIRLMKVEKRKDVRMACLVIFSRLQRCTTLQVRTFAVHNDSYNNINNNSNKNKNATTRKEK